MRGLILLVDIATATIIVTAENDDPVVVGGIADQELDEYFGSTSISLVGVFSDPDSDPLTYTAISSTPGVVTVSVVGSLLTVTEVGLGVSTITVTASDGSLTVDDVFTVTVNDINGPPVVVGGIADQELDEYFGSTSISLVGVFSDPDSDPLTYTAISSTPGVVTVSVVGSLLTVTEVGLGVSTITLTASDGSLTVDDLFTVTVNDINGPPVVVGGIADQELDEYFGSTSISLVGVFSDPDSDPLTYTAISSTPGVVTVSVVGSLLTVTEVGLGVSTITLTASDGSLTVDDLFTVTVNDINGPPVVVGGIADQELDEYFGSTSISLVGVFSDPDSDPLTYTAISSTPGVVTVSVVGSLLTVTEVGLGVSTITLTASDGSLTVDDLFTVTVNDINGPPVVVGGIADQELDEYFGSTSISLVGVFSDPDSDPLTYTAISSTPGVVTVSVVGSLLTVTEVGLGVSTITLTASDGSLTVDDLFTVTVNDINGPPVVVGGIADQELDEYFGSTSISLVGVFSDPDSDPLTYTAISSTPGVVTVSVVGSLLTVTEVGLGVSTITLTASDGSLTVDDLFTVTVNDINGPPVVVGGIADQELDEYFGSTSISLVGVFSDPDSDPLTYTAISSTPGVVTVSVVGSLLTVTEVGLGVSTITVTASDGSLTVDDLFTVTVNDINGPPVVVGGIADQELDEYFGSTSISLVGVFSDPDSDPLTYTAISSTPGVVTVSVVGSLLTVTEVGLGVSTITVTASDGSLTVDDVFTVTVNDINGPPVVVGGIADQELDEYFGSTSISLVGVFSDPDSDPLTYTAISSTPGVVTVSVVGSLLTVTEVGLGVSTITVTASDGSLTVDDLFTVTVNDIIILPPGWEVNPPDFNHSGQITAKVYINGSPLESGFLAAFVGEECRGIVDTSYFPPSDHFVYSLMFYSNNAVGDTLTFKYYDPVEDKIYKMDTSFLFIPDMIVGNAITPKLMYEGVDYINSFKVGWNWFSVNARYDNMSLNSVLSSCAMQDDYIKSQDSTATYYSGFGWWGSLDKLNPRDLYKIRVANLCGVKFLGKPVDINTEVVNIVPGWNWIGYYPQSSLHINDALSSLILTQLDNIKSQAEVSTYYDGVGWFGDLDSLKSTEGYMIKVTLPGTLAYPEIPELKCAIVYQEEDKTGFCPDRFEFSGTMTAKVVIGGEQDRDEGNLLLAIVKDEVRGVVESHYFAPLDVWLYPLMIHSNLAEGEIVQFRFYDNKNDKFYSCEETLTFKNDMIVADAFKAFELNVKSGTGINEPESTDGFELKSYPNPFDMALNIEYQIKVQAHISLTIYDISGRIIDIPVDQLQDPDRYIIRWDSSVQPAGTYIIKLNAGEKQIIRKVSLVR